MNAFESCLAKQAEIKTLFEDCVSTDSKYQKIIEWGRRQIALPPQYKIAENLVKGCQSTVYLRAYPQEGKIFFEIEADALISSGLASLLTYVYSGETPETILKCPPNYLEDIGITHSLSPNRANGLYSIHLRMKQEALRFILDAPRIKF